MLTRSPFGPKFAPLARFTGLCVLVVAAATFEVGALGRAWHRGILGIDMEHGLLPLAELVRHGSFPWASQRYPPLVPVVLVPFTFLPSAPIVLAALAAVCVPLTLWALDVRDWRCYAAAFLWPPVFSAIQTANVTMVLVLAAALAWRYRERAGLCAAASGLAIGAKLISLPLVAWLAATGRLRAAAGSCVVALVATVGLGVVVQTTLTNDSSRPVGRLVGIVSDKGTRLTPSYSLSDIARSAGSSTTGAIIVLGVAIAGLMALSVVRGRRGDDVGSFSLACLATLVAAPNVWLHSFAFLLPVVALARPRFSPAWLVPLLFFAVPVVDPAAWEIVVAWGVTAALSFHLLWPRASRVS